MKKAIWILSFFSLGFFYSCDGNQERKTSEEEEYKIQGEETGGMGTGPGPGVSVPVDTAEETLPDTIRVD